MSKKKVLPEWITEQQDFLKKKFPQDIQNRVFLPPKKFYSQYEKKMKQNPQEGLELMAKQIFDWLKIKREDCFFGFHDRQTHEAFSSDAAGYYTKLAQNGGEREVIMINVEHMDNPMKVGAILAHEMMHLYLFRLGIRLDDDAENELLTDLATIETGLAVLILNGMKKQTDWHITAIALLVGMIYWRSEKRSFGYFEPPIYAKHALDYFNKIKKPTLERIMSYVTPLARGFIPDKEARLQPSRNTFTPYVEKEDQKAQKIWLGLILGIVGLVVLMVFAEYLIEAITGKPTTIFDTPKGELRREIAECQPEVEKLKQIVEDQATAIESTKRRMDRYELSSDMENYNKLVEPYNNLLDRAKINLAFFERQREECNAKIRRHNAL